MGNHSLLRLVTIAAIIVLWPLLPASSFAQGRSGARRGGQAQARPPAPPTPRQADGRVNLGALAGQKGYWGVGTGSLTGRGGSNLQTNLLIEEVPFQPWAKALYEYRRSTLSKDDPHARCLAPGGPRQFHTPFGLQIVDLPDIKQILILSGGGPRTWRVIYMDGRLHPSPDVIDPMYLGHSVGHWEGDTLVVDTVGFNEKFWFHRGGLVHTDALHLIERISRPDFNTLKYEATVDDPKAYTKPWTGGWTIPWTPNEDIAEYFCQDNERDAKRLVGQ